MPPFFALSSVTNFFPQDGAHKTAYEIQASSIQDSKETIDLYMGNEICVFYACPAMSLAPFTFPGPLQGCFAVHQPQCLQCSLTGNC